MEAVAQTTAVRADSNSGSAGAETAATVLLYSVVAGTPVPVRVDDLTTEPQLAGFVRQPHADPKAPAVPGTAGAREPGSVWVMHPLAGQSLYFTEQSVIAVLVLTRVPALGL
jgi:hypothetical protein